MIFPVDKTRFKLFLRIGLIYLLISLFADFVSNHDRFWNRYFVLNIWQALFVMPLAYNFYENLVPKITRKRMLNSLAILFGQLVLFSFVHYLWYQLGLTLQLYAPPKEPGSIGHQIGDNLGDSIGAILFFGILRHIYDYRKLKIMAQQLRIEKQAAELNYLKSQTNPHFLFNTLNNIYSLARDKSDLAPESIMRLSKILRYMLYETSGNFIAIEQELKIIADYIELEKLRYDESLSIGFKYDVEDMKQALPPLLLIPLVENAFKHGVSETRSRPFVDIYLSVNQRKLKFMVKNSVDGMPDEKTPRESIGLTNLRRQLQLLYKEYELNLDHSASVFTAELKINLASYV
ncbi:sensor histidine kinase [Pollutibacter soli]|uniref:sensor histidine kinase n=1 Tax=Pollutibacter soli TaxID=3034157 RepID=UPI003013C00D